jgi:hypothetical protein
VQCDLPDATSDKLLCVSDGAQANGGTIAHCAM